MRKGFVAPRVIPEAIILAGGLDVVTPPFQLKPGRCRAAQNFEASIYGGYRRIAGYERSDGQAAPSDGQYTILAATAITGGAVGNTLHGATSGATGIILAITATYFVLTATTGTFQAENLNVGAGTIAVSSGAGTIGGAGTAKLDAQYKNLAADYYRTLVAAVPGSGKTLGGFFYNDVNYAFRNNAGGTAAALYKSTAAGWSLVAFGEEISFTNANTSVDEGDTLTQGGVTATIARVVLQTGTFASGVNTGRLILTGRAGGNFAAGAATSTGGGALTLSGVQTAITLLPDGRFEAVISNFTGSTSTKRVYWVDGVNRAHEFDGTTTVPISTGMVTDKPTHIQDHLYQLFLGFRGGSIQHSAPGFPYQWTIITGAAEIAIGDDPTGFQVLPGTTTQGALAIFTTGRVSILYGTGDSDYQLIPQRDEIGAVAYTIQSLVQPTFLDQQGITDLATTQRFGNFVSGVLSNSVKTFLTQWKTTAIASSISRDLSQYRIFFTNNFGFYMTMVGEKPIGLMPVLFAHTVRCAWHGRKNDGSEISFFGGDDGFVFQMDRGTSFDGSDIEAYINLAYNFSHGVRTLKGYRDGALEVSGSGYTEFSFGYSLGYGLSSVIQPDAATVVSNLQSVFWDAFTWDAFTWDGVTLAPSTVEITGEAENISLAITSVGDYFSPFSITGGVINYTPRRQIR
jgi:hypothetical protein